MNKTQFIFSSYNRICSEGERDEEESLNGGSMLIHSSTLLPCSYDQMGLLEAGLCARTV
jgi:hypothetical protein